MKKTVYGIILLILTLGFSGCAGTVKHMNVASVDKTMEAPKNGKSKIVFMRPKAYGYAVQSSVFEINNNQPSIVGIVPAKKKISYELEPGQHFFMVVGESADFMTATVEANKTYYVLVVPRMGLWKARFSLRPIHTNEFSTEELNAWLNECQLLEISEETQKWADENSDSTQSKYNEYYKDWMEKEAATRPALLIEDGK